MLVIIKVKQKIYNNKDYHLGASESSQGQLKKTSNKKMIDFETSEGGLKSWKAHTYIQQRHITLSL